MRPRDRFSKRSHKRYKRLPRLSGKLPVNEGVVLIPGRTFGCEHPYLEVYAEGRRYGKVYFEGKPTREWVQSQMSDFMKEI